MGGHCVERRRFAYDELTGGRHAVGDCTHGACRRVPGVDGTLAFRSLVRHRIQGPQTRPAHLPAGTLPRKRARIAGGGGQR